MVVEEEQAITPDEYFLLSALSRKLSQNQQLADDLTQEVAIYFMELSPLKKAELRSKNLVKPWFIRTILNQDRSKTSYFYRRYKTEPKIDSIDLAEIQDFEFEETEHNEQLDLVKDWIEELFVSDQNIIKDYFEKGLTIMGIASKYDIDKNHVVGVINRIKNSFYRRLIWIKIPRKNLENNLAEFLAPMLGRKRLKVEERQLILDAHNFLYKTKYNTYFDRELCSLLLKSLIQKLKL